MAIPLNQSMQSYTQTSIAKYKENINVPTFLQSMFKVKTTTDLYLDIMVRRGTERISVDVVRGSDGTRNTFSNSTEKIFKSLYYKEEFDASALDRYNKMSFGQASGSEIGGLAAETAENLRMLQDKIARAKEKQCADVLNTGVVTLADTSTIDFKRKAASLVDLSGSGGYWSTTTTDVETQLIAVGDFFRTKGKSNVKEIDAIMSSAEWVALKKTNYFTADASFNNVQLNDIRRPIADSTGASFHGQITAGSYTFNVWTYDEIYENSSGTQVRYIASNKVVFVPVSGTDFVMGHAGVPTVFTDVSKAEFNQYIRLKGGEYVVSNYVDVKRTAHIFRVESAPLAIPVTIDLIYTAQALA